MNKKRKKEISIPKYSLKEELINAISHGIGGGLAIAALVLCIIKSKNAWSVVSTSIYGSFMIILYIISCIYHALSPRVKGKKVLRVIDHCNVFLMLAGTYMPICLSLLNGVLGWVVFSIVWTITIVAIVLNGINVDKYQVASVICHLILGWGSLLLITPLKQASSMHAVWILIIGGIIYTIGSIIYGIGSRVPYMHSVFHFFVLAGSICHFFFIYLYCI